MQVHDGQKDVFEISDTLDPNEYLFLSNAIGLVAYTFHKQYNFPNLLP